jgi:hypothetical protein
MASPEGNLTSVAEPCPTSMKVASTYTVRPRRKCGVKTIQAPLARSADADAAFTRLARRRWSGSVTATWRAANQASHEA